MLIVVGANKFMILENIFRVLMLLFFMILPINCYAYSIDNIEVTSLIKAVSDKDIEKAQLLLNKGVEIDEQIANGFTALMFSASTSNYEAVMFLLKNGADVNIKSNKGMTALFVASTRNKENSTNIVKLLLEHGAVIDIEDNRGNTPLTASILGGNAQTTRLLLDEGADLGVVNSRGFTPLKLAVFSKKPEIIKLLLNRGVVPKDVLEIIKLAIFFREKNSLELLLNAGFKTNLTDALSLAVNNQFGDAIEILIEQGADINLKISEREITPLIFAAQNGHVNLVRFLLVKGANINLKDNASKNALYYAEENGSAEIVEMLIFAAK